ncbi:10345_t:CDS:2, partial [Funneliformis caledonium]
MSEKACILLDATFNVFNAVGEIDFIKSWKRIEKPFHWCRMLNPLKHHQSFMFSDMLKLSMLMLFILRRFLKPHHIKSDALNNWSAKALKLVFSNTMSENIYQEFQESLNREHDVLIQNALNNLTSDPKLYTILSDWYATESPFILTNIQNDEDENSS